MLMSYSETSHCPQLSSPFTSLYYGSHFSTQVHPQRTNFLWILRQPLLTPELPICPQSGFHVWGRTALSEKFPGGEILNQIYSSQFCLLLVTMAISFSTGTPVSPFLNSQSPNQLKSLFDFLSQSWKRLTFSKATLINAFSTQKWNH